MPKKSKNLMLKTSSFSRSFELASEQYAELGVDVSKALAKLSEVSISLHCWQGDDVRGFESNKHQLPSDGLAVTGQHPGRATTPQELRDDLQVAFDLIPGKHRLNLHACYGESTGCPVPRNLISVDQFKTWIQWAIDYGIAIDFNPTFFSHSKVRDGFTLSHWDHSIRQYWIEHGIACRRIGEQIGRELGKTCITNFWIPDGYKDTPADRFGPRQRLADSLDAIFDIEIDKRFNLDAVECKLFGIGSESYVVGSHEFYLGYAASRQKLLCLDSGHFHPTEVISDKISSVLMYVPALLLHVSRGIRWDSDHVVTLSEETIAIAQEIVRADLMQRTHIGLDFFDASINRVAAWVVGSRNVLKSILFAMLEPSSELRRLERQGRLTERLALMEQLKQMPWGAVWNYYCLTSNVPVGLDWLDVVKNYETSVQSLRPSAPNFVRDIAKPKKRNLNGQSFS